MMTLVIGGSGSGKSEFAENLLKRKEKEGAKYYLATMRIFDEDGKRRVLRHQKMRADKGFVTIEQPVNINVAAGQIQRGAAVLLECVSNLVANEMFGNHIETIDQVQETVVNGIMELQQKAGNLVIVTNNVFEDGNVYDESTMNYMRALAGVNQILCEKADRVYEVVIGIPLSIKETCV